MRTLLYVLALTVILISCKKTRDCLSGAGNEIVLESELSEFDSLYVNDVFEIHLIQDTVNYIIISAHRAFAEATTYQIDRNTLILDNEFKCDFLKPDKDDIKIFLHVKKLSLIILNETSNVITDNMMINDNEIGMINHSKFNEADLNLNCKTFYFWNTHLNGGKLKLKGSVEVLKLWHTSLLSVDALNLSADHVLIDTKAYSDTYINVNNILDCKIGGYGNVYYRGDPETIIYEDSTDTGKLIKLE